jgi:hypothetical protein
MEDVSHDHSAAAAAASAGAAAASSTSSASAAAAGGSAAAAVPSSSTAVSAAARRAPVFEVKKWNAVRARTWHAHMVWIVLLVCFLRLAKCLLQCATAPPAIDLHSASDHVLTMLASASTNLSLIRLVLLCVICSRQLCVSPCARRCSLSRRCCMCVFRWRCGRGTWSSIRVQSAEITSCQKVHTTCIGVWDMRFTRVLSALKRIAVSISTRTCAPLLGPPLASARRLHAAGAELTLIFSECVMSMHALSCCVCDMCCVCYFDVCVRMSGICASSVKRTIRVPVPRIAPWRGGCAIMRFIFIASHDG